MTSITIPFIGQNKNINDNSYFGYIFKVSDSDKVPESLKKVKVTNVTTIPANAFYNCKNLTSIELPKNVTSIGGGAFEGCNSLTNIDISELELTTIDDSTFKGCSSLKSIEIPDSVTSIDNSAFYGCSGLETITIPSKVTSIGISAFERSGIISITIPSSVTYIGKTAFYDCNKLTSITFENTSGWYCAFSPNGTAGYDIDVSDSNANPALFEHDLYTRYLKRR